MECLDSPILCNGPSYVSLMTLFRFPLRNRDTIMLLAKGIVNPMVELAEKQ